MSTTKIYKNKPLLLLNAVMAQHNVVIWGRATGKTEGATADFLLNNVNRMPRSTNALASVTLEHLLNVEIPGLKLGFKRQGLIQDKHYTVRKRPPKIWGWAQPLREPENADNCIYFPNGSIIQLFGLSRTINNGMSNDSASYQEARFLNRNKWKEFDLTVRGNNDRWGDLSCLHSRQYTTDMPQTAESKWLLDLADKCDEELIAVIIGTQLKRQRELLKKRSAKTEEEKTKIQYWINYYDKRLNGLRKGTVYASFATTLDNAKVLGINTIRDFATNLTDQEYDTSVLNLRNDGTLFGYYAKFNDERHTYTASNHSHVEGLEWDDTEEVNCLWDSDHNPEIPLDMAMDWNVEILPVVIGQPHHDSYRIINSMHVMHPLHIKDLCHKIAKYYASHRHKVINFYYDATGSYRHPKDEVTNAGEFVSKMTALGWKVNKMYIGQLQSQEYRYSFYSTIFGGSHNLSIPNIKLNRYRNKWLIKSMLGAKSKPTKSGYEKDKKDERNKSLDQRTTTHYSDALDQLLMGLFANRYTNEEFTEIYPSL